MKPHHVLLPQDDLLEELLYKQIGVQQSDKCPDWTKQKEPNVPAPNCRIEPHQHIYTKINEQQLGKQQNI
jgi:hypothetical protein